MCVFSRFRWRLRELRARSAPACPPASRLPTLSMGCVRTAKTKHQMKTAETSERRGERSRRGESRPFLVIITLSFLK